MRNYIILNGNNSNTISGLLIQSLPPISKPLMRTAIEEIDGRDGDIVTNLGYSAYDKEVSIGLYGSYDVDEVIKYFSDNSKGQVTFSNEPDKYYNYEIINQIDFERLIRFKTAIVTLHCQPFKYPTDETPVEINIQNITNEAEEMDLDNTADAPMKLDLKGNTQQDSTTGKNLLKNTLEILKTNNTSGTWSGNVYTLNGVTFTYNDDGSIKVNGTASANTTFYISRSSLYQYTTLSAGTYYVTTHETTGGDNTWKVQFNIGGSAINVYGTGNNKEAIITPTESVNVFLYIYVYSGENPNNAVFYPMIATTSGVDYEKFSFGVSPNPNYPQEIHNVSGDNTIEICGKNLYKPLSFSRTNNGVDFSHNLDGTITANNTATANAFSMNSSQAVSNNCVINLLAGTYTISGGKSNVYVNLVDLNGANISTTTSADLSKTFTINEDTQCFLRIQVPNGTSVSNETIYPMLEKNNEATTYEAYQSNSQLISLGVENLVFDEIVGKYFYSNGNITSDSKYVMTLMYVKNGETYTLSQGNASSVYFNRSGQYNGSDSALTNIVEIASTSQTFTFTSTFTGTMAICSRLTTSEDFTPIEVQCEKGTKANSYTPYGASYIELNKISTYQDYIYKENDRWFLHKEIGKVVLDGSEDWVLETNGRLRLSNSQYFNDRKLFSTSYEGLICNYYVVKSSGDYYIRWRGTNEYNINIYNKDISSANDFKTWLSTHNTEIYYVLDAPTDTEITDSTLISQLNNLANARSYDTSTHITQNANDKPFILNATAVQKGTDTATVDNDGNIYSKPTLDIEGNGIVAIYLNGNQMFSVDLSNSDECVIDVTNLEAYDPETNDLMNRQVTGDYSKFILPVGENQVKVSGNVTKATITDYVRWL